MDTAYLPVHQIPLPQPVRAGSVPPVFVDWEPWDKRLMGAQHAPSTVLQPPDQPLHGVPRGSIDAGRARRCPGVFSQTVRD